MLLCWFLFILLFKGLLTFDQCEKSTTCTDCIRNSNICVWCADKKFDNTTRCVPLSSYKDGWCSEVVPTKDDAVYIKSFSPNNTNPQITPLKYEMKQRIGTKQNFTFTYKNSNNPVDLYFLFDVSKIMKTKMENIASKIEIIYKAVQDLTKNVTVGMGTFIGKNTFNSEENSNLTYSFKHQLALTENYTKFNEAMNSASFGYKKDPPIGCFDAIAQAIVCGNAIKWRTESKKIIILITSRKYHEASDSRAANIYKPYKEQCFLDETTKKYTKELEMDYPSVGVINKLVDQYKVTVLFFVESSVKSVYQSLSDATVGSYIDDWLDIPTTDTTARTLKNIYKNIVEDVTVNIDISPESKKSIKVSIVPDCTQGKMKEECKVQTDQSITFNGVVEFLDDNGIDKASAEISVQGIKDKLSLDINIVSKCKCKGNEKTSKICNGRPLECGQCKCDDELSECDFHGSICNGHKCSCGTCICNYPFSGKFCQCNQVVCNEKMNGNGACVDGVCQCNEQWTGTDCSCPKSQDMCKGSNGSICNGRGKCNCGKCACEELSDWDPRHQDSLCDIHLGADTHTNQCTKLGSFVLQYYNEERKDNETNIIVTTSETVKENEDSTWKLCPELSLENGCYTHFAYKYDGYGIKLLVQTYKNCDENIGKVCGILFTTLLLVGIGTLIAWKVVTDRRDKKEYLSLMKTYNLDSGVRTNTLYVEPCVTFKNPSYKPDTPAKN